MFRHSLSFESLQRRRVDIPSPSTPPPVASPAHHSPRARVPALHASLPEDAPGCSTKQITASKRVSFRCRPTRLLRAPLRHLRRLGQCPRLHRHGRMLGRARLQRDRAAPRQPHAPQLGALRPLPDGASRHRGRGHRFEAASRGFRRVPPRVHIHSGCPYRCVRKLAHPGTPRATRCDWVPRRRR